MLLRYRPHISHRYLLIAVLLLAIYQLYTRLHSSHLRFDRSLRTQYAALADEFGNQTLWQWYLDVARVAAPQHTSLLLEDSGSRVRIEHVNAETPRLDVAQLSRADFRASKAAHALIAGVIPTFL